MHNKVIKYVVTTAILLILSFLMWLLTYKLEIALDSISNSIFFVNICALLIGVMLQTGSTRLFIGFNYGFKTLFKYKEMKEKYETFKDYYDETADDHKKNVLHIIYVSGALVFVSIILSAIYLS